MWANSERQHFEQLALSPNCSDSDHQCRFERIINARLYCTDFFFFLFKPQSQSRNAPKCCLSLHPLLTCYCWCDWDKKVCVCWGGWGVWGQRRGLEGGTRMSGEKIQTISTILKTQFSSVSTSFLRRRARGKQTEETLQEWQRRCSARRQPWESGCVAGRGCDAMQVVQVPVCSVDVLFFSCLNAHRSAGRPRPAAEPFTARAAAAVCSASRRSSSVLFRVCL